MNNLTFEFFIALQLLLSSVLILCVFFNIRIIRRKEEKYISEKLCEMASKKVPDLLEPLLKDAYETSAVFANQIKEKKNIINKLNNNLDDKIININMILKRAKQYLQKDESQDGNVKQNENTIEPELVSNQQEKILSLHKKGISNEDISKKLNIAKGEIDLIIGLKKKLLNFGSV